MKVRIGTVREMEATRRGTGRETGTFKIRTTRTEKAFMAEIPREMENLRLTEITGVEVREGKDRRTEGPILTEIKKILKTEEALIKIKRKAKLIL